MRGARFHGRAERLDWARAAGILDIRTGAFVEIGSPGGADRFIPESRRAAVRDLLVAEGSGTVAGLLVGEGGTPLEGAGRFREILLQDRSGYLFCRLLRDGRFLLVETEPVGSPGRIWVRIKVLTSSLTP